MLGRNQKGYTLVEMTVSMSIFAIVVAISIGLFVNILNIQTQSNSIRAVQQNSRFAFEEFFRQVRLAQGFYNTPPDPSDPPVCSELPDGMEPTDDNDRSLAGVDADGDGNSSEEFAISNYKGEVVIYSVENINGRNAFVARNLGNICKAHNTIVTQLTGPDVSVTGLRIFRDLKNGNDKPPGMVTLRMTVESFPTSSRVALNQSLTSEVTVSLRSEFCNYFPKECLP